MQKPSCQVQVNADTSKSIPSTHQTLRSWLRCGPYTAAENPADQKWQTPFAPALQSSPDPCKEQLTITMQGCQAGLAYVLLIALVLER